ncbi:hypothetical protein J1N35_002491 [Gossypium stocksii]|uniref:DUF7745 domain-containing protein n=1 Tax=Gossypium stocksii TaxID=47602 RepID=A0A9D3WMM9_9ROSI|nr:hypothetical protein J1N35_002491 [Gossypium stocksii]
MGISRSYPNKGLHIRGKVDDDSSKPSKKDVEWRASWMVPDEILYRCGNFDWVPLPGIWGAIGYAPLLVLRQYMAKHFVPATHGLAQYDFPYKGDNYKKKVREISDTWKKIHQMNILAVGSVTTPKYNGWLSRQINDNIPSPSQEGVQLMEEYLRIIPSELEIMRQEFKKMNLEFGKRIERLEKEKIYLRLDANVQKLEDKKLRKGKKKAEEDLDDLNTEYKRLHTSMRNTGLGKTLEQ